MTDKIEPKTEEVAATDDSEADTKHTVVVESEDSCDEAESNDSSISRRMPKDEAEPKAESEGDASHTKKPQGTQRIPRKSEFAKKTGTPIKTKGLALNPHLLPKGRVMPLRS